uniref:Uncharacterized protein n=1 Tax=Oryza punctata TaxID=4537 RepID=A0A0E0KDE1_ORYPU
MDYITPATAVVAPGNGGGCTDPSLPTLHPQAAIAVEVAVAAVNCNSEGGGCWAAPIPPHSSPMWWRLYNISKSGNCESPPPY